MTTSNDLAKDKEIEMWRRRFLENLSEYEDIHKTIYISRMFNSASSYEILITTPEKLIQEIAEDYSRDNK